MAVVAEIVVPAPPPLTPTEAGAETAGHAYQLTVPATAAEPIRFVSVEGYEFRARPAELCFRDRWGLRDYVTGSAPVSLSTDGFGARYHRLFPSADDVYLLQAEGVKNITLLSEIPREPAEYLDPEPDPETGLGIEFGITWEIGGVPLPPGLHTELEAWGFWFPRPVVSALDGARVEGRYEVLEGDEGQTMVAWFPYQWFQEHPGPYHIDPTVATTTHVSPTAYSNQRKMFRASNGNLVALWVQKDGTYDYNTYYSVSQDGGANWSPAAQLLPVIYASQNAGIDAVIGPDDTLYILHTANYAWKIGYCTPNAGRTQWTFSGVTTGICTDTVDFNKFRAGSVRLLTDAGSVILPVVYVTGNYVLRAVAIVIAPDGSKSTTGSVQLASHSEAVNGLYPALARQSDSQVLLAYTTAATGTGKGVRARLGTWANSTLTWGADEAVDESAYAANGVISAARDVVAYRRSSDNRLVVRRRNAQGVWSDVAGLPTITSPTSVSVTRRGDDIYLKFTDGSGVKSVVWKATTGTWGNVTTIDSTASAKDVVACDDGANVDVLYTIGSASPYTIKSARVLVNAPPYEPLIQVSSPAFDAATGVKITVIHRDQDGDPPGGIALKRRNGSTDEWWNNTSKQWQTQEVFNAPVGTYTTPDGVAMDFPAADNAGKWTTGQVYPLWAATRDSLGQTGPYMAVPVVVNAGAKPVPSFVNPPSIANSGLTVFQWSVNVPFSAVQVRQINVNTGQVVLDTGKVATTNMTAYLIPTPDNLTTYRTELTVWDQTAGGGVASDPITATYSTNFTTPNAVRSLVAMADATLAAVKVKWSRDSVYTASLARSSVAYLPDGSQVASGAPRYWNKNLLTANQSSVETDLTGFGAYRSTLARDTTVRWQGAASIKATNNYGSTDFGPYTGVTPTPVSQGQTYTASAYAIQGNVAGMRCYVKIDWLNSSQQFIAQSPGPNVYLANNWQRLTVTADPPANAAYAAVAVYANGNTNDFFYVDGLQLEESSVATPWRPGGVGSTITVEESTTNLLTANQSSVETDLTGFVAEQGATLSRDTTQAWHGSACLKVTTPGAVTMEGFYVYISGGTAGQPYTGSVYLWGSGNIHVGLYRDGATNLAFKTVTLSAIKQRVTVSGTADANGQIRLYVRTNGAQAVTFYADGLQIEQKAYATSFVLGGTTRAAETLTPPTPVEAIESGEFALEFDYTPTSNPAVTGRFARLWSCRIDSNNYYELIHHETGRVYAEIKSGGTTVITYSSSDPVLVQGQKYRIGFRLSGGKASHYVNSVKGAAGDKTYTKPVGTLPATCQFGGSPQANGLFGPARFSQNRPAADMSNTGPLAWDQYTVQLYTWANTLEGGTQPSVFSGQYEVYRDGVRIAIVNNPASGDVEYLDYGVASGVSYTYSVRAVGSNGTYGPSVNVSGGVTIDSGIFLHDPLDPANTIHWYQYRDIPLTDERAIPYGVFEFAGRTAPAVQMDARMLNRNVKVRIACRKDSDDLTALQNLFARRSTVCFRDHRGRKVYGVLVKLPTSEERWGGWVDMELLAVDFVEGV